MLNEVLVVLRLDGAFWLMIPCIRETRLANTAALSKLLATSVLIADSSVAEAALLPARLPRAALRLPWTTIVGAPGALPATVVTCKPG